MNKDVETELENNGSICLIYKLLLRGTSDYKGMGTREYDQSMEAF